MTITALVVSIALLIFGVFMMNELYGSRSSEQRAKLVALIIILVALAAVEFNVYLAYLAAH